MHTAILLVMVMLIITCLSIAALTHSMHSTRRSTQKYCGRVNAGAVELPNEQKYNKTSYIYYRSVPGKPDHAVGIETFRDATGHSYIRRPERTPHSPINSTDTDIATTVIATKDRACHNRDDCQKHFSSRLMSCAR